MSATIAAVCSTAVCSLPDMGAALRRIEALHAGKPVEQSPETEHLPNDIESLLAYCRAKVADIHGVVQTAFEELDKINDPETNGVAKLLDEIL